MSGNQQVVPTFSSLSFTSDSEVVEQAALVAKSTMKQWRKSRLFFLRDQRDKSGWIDRRDGRSLSFTIRVSHQPTKNQPSRSYLLLEFTLYPPYSGNRFKVGNIQERRRLNTPIKRKENDEEKDVKLTISLGLTGVGQRRNRYQKLYRFLDKERLRESKTLFNWRTLYFDPYKSSIDQFHFLFLLNLRQQQMVDESTDDILLELLMKCFPFRVKKYAIIVLKDGLLPNFTSTEDWRAMKKYIGRQLKTCGRKYGEGFDPRIIKLKPLQERPSDSEFSSEDDPEIAQKAMKVKIRDRPPQQNGITDDRKGLYAVKEAAEILSKEKYSVSPDRLHNWINKKKISCKLIRGIRYFDDTQLSIVRSELKHHPLIYYLVTFKGKTKEAASKYVNRHLRLGYSLVAIKKKIREIPTAMDEE